MRETKCPKCGRRYYYDYCLAKLRPAIRQPRAAGPCDYCQKPYRETRAAIRAAVGDE